MAIYFNHGYVTPEDLSKPCPCTGNPAGPSRDQQRLLREHGAHRQLQMFLGKGMPDMNWAVAARKPQLVDDYTTELWL